MKSEIEQYQEVCDAAGVHFVEANGQFVFFTDKITKQTLSVKRNEFNNARVQVKVRVHRKKYSKDVDMLSDFTDAIRFLTKKYHIIPEQIVMESALAATLPIQKFVNDQKLLSEDSNEKIAA